MPPQQGKSLYSFRISVREEVRARARNRTRRFFVVRASWNGARQVHRRWFMKREDAMGFSRRVQASGWDAAQRVFPPSA